MILFNEMDGDLEFRGIQTLTRFPAFRIRGTLICHQCRNLRSMPDRLKVPRMLRLTECSPEMVLPEGLSVGLFLVLTQGEGPPIPREHRIEGGIIRVEKDDEGV